MRNIQPYGFSDAVLFIILLSQVHLSYCRNCHVIIIIIIIQISNYCYSNIATYLYRNWF